MSSTDQQTTDYYVALADAVVTAEQDRADRADPGLGPLVEARDLASAGGRFELADSQQAVIDHVRAATREQLDEARGWVSDCMWREEPEELEELTDAQIVAGVDQHYDGGWAELVRNAELDGQERE